MSLPHKTYQDKSLTGAPTLGKISIKIPGSFDCMGKGGFWGRIKKKMKDIQNSPLAITIGAISSFTLAAVAFGFMT